MKMATSKRSSGEIVNRRVLIAGLTPHPRNYNQHDPSQIANLRASLHEFGQVRSIVVQATARPGQFLIVAGHGIVQAAQAEGLKALKADVIPAAWKPARVLAYLAADNELARRGNPDEAQLAAIVAEVQKKEGDVLARLAAGEQKALDALLRIAGGDGNADADPQIDRAAELNKIWQVKTGDLFRIGVHRLLCGDSMKHEDVKRIMQDERIEMVWIDPPYGVAVGDKNKFLNSIAPSNRIEENLENDTLDEAGLIAMLCASFDNAIEACTAGAAWYVAAPAGPLHILFGQVLKERGIWRQTIQRVKNNSTFSPMGVCYHWQAEPLFFGWLPNAGHRYYGGRAQTTVWQIDRPLKSPEHPTMKPVALVARAIGNSSKADEIVYDGFSGSGTTLVACENLHRRGRGIEISPAYCAVTLQRMVDAFPGIEIERVTDNGEAKTRKRRH
jgi:DNA modification methylase